MEPKSSCRPTIIVIVLVVLATVHSLPTGRREAPPTPDQPIAVNKLIRSLTTITNSNDNLYFLWEEAIYLTNENLMMAEVSVFSDCNYTHAYNIYVVSYYSIN